MPQKNGKRPGSNGNASSDSTAHILSRAARCARAPRNRAANDNAMRAFRAASRGGTVVPNDDIVPLPAEPGKLPWTVQRGTATLNFNASPAEMGVLIALAEEVLDNTADKRNQPAAARQMVNEALAGNAHFIPAVGNLVAGMVMWLAMTDGYGSLITSGRLAYCGYIIEPSRQPGGSPNFRFVSRRVNGVNDNNGADH